MVNEFAFSTGLDTALLTSSSGEFASANKILNKKTYIVQIRNMEVVLGVRVGHTNIVDC